MTTIITKADALSLFDGNASALARAIEVDPSTVSKWRDGQLSYAYSAAVLLAAGRLQPKRRNATANRDPLFTPASVCSRALADG